MTTTSLRLPHSPPTLRHDPLEIDLPKRMVPAWSTPLDGLGPRLALTTVDSLAVLVSRDGVAVLDAIATGDLAAWSRVTLVSGHPGSAVEGSLPWIADGGQLFRFGLDGTVTPLNVLVDGALALDEERVLIVPRGRTGTLSMLINGAEKWRSPGTLADACPGAGVIVTGAPRDVERLSCVDLDSGRTLWTRSPAPHRLAAVIAVHDDLIWVACTDSTLAALRIADGSLAYAHDTGVTVPVGAVDAARRLQLCHEVAWVSVQLTPERNVQHRPLSGVARLIDPPVPLRGGGILVRTVRGEVLCLGDGGTTAIWSGKKAVRSVAAAAGRLYLLEGDDPPILHCLRSAA